MQTILRRTAHGFAAAPRTAFATKCKCTSKELAATITAVRAPTNSLGKTLQAASHSFASDPAASTSDRGQDLAATYLFSDQPLWDEQHVPAWSLGLALYLPLGCAIAFVRILLWCGGVLLDLPSFQSRAVSNAWLALLGVRVTWKHLERLPLERHVLVSNHRTPCDLLALFTLPRRYVHLITPGMPAAVTKAQNLPVLLRPATLDAYDELARGDAPIHLFPEGGLTNGSGMMLFTRSFMKFASGMPVVPVALRARTAFGLRTHTLTSSFPANLWWISFSPFLDLEATVLAPLPPVVVAGQAKGAYVQRAQEAIAEELGVPIRGIGIKDKRRVMQLREEQLRR